MIQFSSFKHCLILLIFPAAICGAELYLDYGTFFGKVNRNCRAASGQSVYIANWYGTTGNNGKYSIDIGNVARSGSLSASAIVDGITYNFELPSQSNNTKITLPAMYRFHDLRPRFPAHENDVTKGTGKTTFSPDAPCTRAQVVTFLYRYLKPNQ